MKFVFSAGLLALMFLPQAASAAVFHDTRGVCQITVPAGWTEHPGRVVAPTPGFYARVRSGATAAEIQAGVAAAGATLVYDNPQRSLYTASASAGGQTNKLYFAVSKTTPGCLATVTFPAGPLDAQARAIAESVHPG